MTKLIVRLLDSAGQMLGWQQAEGVLRGDGQVSVDRVIEVPIEKAGAPHTASVHWVDVNVEIVTPVYRVETVRVGDVVAVFQPGPVFRVGPQAGGLPPITTRGPVTVHVLAGALGAMGNA